MNDDRLAALEARVANVEATLQSLAATRTTAAAPQSKMPARPASNPAPAAPMPVPRVREKSSLETLVAGRGLQVAGLLLVLSGIAFFLQLAFTRNWIGPLERISIGLIAGTILFVAADRLMQKARRLAEGFVALAAGVLYLSLWASVGVFPELHVPRGGVFVAMLMTTIALAAVSVRRSSIAVALMGACGGYLTPLLLAGGPVDHLVLAGYLFVLSAGMLAIAVREAYIAVAFAAFIAVCIYAPQFDVDPLGWTRWHALSTATAFAIIFAAAASYSTTAGKHVRANLIMLTLSVAMYSLCAAGLLHDRQTTLGALMLAVAFVLLALAQIRTIATALKRAYVYLAIGAVTLAVPALVHNATIVDVFIVESALLTSFGARAKDRWAAACGAIAFAFIGLILVAQSLDQPHDDAVTLGIGFLLWTGCAVFGRRQRGAFDFLRDGGLTLWPFVDAAIHVVVLFGLTRAVVDIFGGHALDSTSSVTQFAISLVWTCYATALFGRGLRTGSKELRWSGLVLYVLIALKVVSVDLSSLAIEYRIGSFVIVGAVLFAVSAWYTRTTNRIDAREPDA